jgi:hypothetical protein
MAKKSLKFRVNAKAIIPAANPQYQNSALHPAVQLGCGPKDKDAPARLPASLPLPAKLAGPVGHGTQVFSGVWLLSLPAPFAIPASI